ncbi:hypothetical protein BC826DRAFT_566680 [Russula brevipes]|nr:hypothetical protein BC826DRAFT_566680 [Russula brevipes]
MHTSSRHCVLATRFNQKKKKSSLGPPYHTFFSFLRHLSSSLFLWTTSRCVSCCDRSGEYVRSSGCEAFLCNLDACELRYVALKVFNQSCIPTAPDLLILDSRPWLPIRDSGPKKNCMPPMSPRRIMRSNLSSTLVMDGFGGVSPCSQATNSCGAVTFANHLAWRSYLHPCDLVCPWCVTGQTRWPVPAMK